MEFEPLPLRKIYAGALFFDAADITTVLHDWAQW